MTQGYREFRTTVGGRELIVETGKYAGQTYGSCVLRCGETAVMVNVTMGEKPREGMDYFPLGVDFEEKMYSVGAIPGGFKRREGRASDKAILTSRLIDRPIRPLFPKGLFNDVIVVATALGRAGRADRDACNAREKHGDKHIGHTFCGSHRQRCGGDS